MALIKCPECGAEISDKSPACIYCGFPLQETKSIDNDIASLFETVLTGNKPTDIYYDVMQAVAAIKSNNTANEANDIIAKYIVDGLSNVCGTTQNF